MIFAVPVSLFLPIALLFLTSHPGVAEKVAIVDFFMLFAGIVWTLVRSNEQKS